MGGGWSGDFDEPLLSRVGHEHLCREAPSISTVA